MNQNAVFIVISIKLHCDIGKENTYSIKKQEELKSTLWFSVTM